tara:strand:+ start:11 stop:235 length:225 start_codon:yes stop_codon:yes gene_type:complete
MRSTNGRFWKVESLDRLTNHKAKTDVRKCNQQFIAPQPAIFYMYSRKWLRISIFQTQGVERAGLPWSFHLCSFG